MGCGGLVKRRQISRLQSHLALEGQADNDTLRGVSDSYGILLVFAGGCVGGMYAGMGLLCCLVWSLRSTSASGQCVLACSACIAGYVCSTAGLG